MSSSTSPIFSSLLPSRGSALEQETSGRAKALPYMVFRRADTSADSPGAAQSCFVDAAGVVADPHHSAVGGVFACLAVLVEEVQTITERDVSWRTRTAAKTLEHHEWPTHTLLGVRRMCSPSVGSPIRRRLLSRFAHSHDPGCYHSTITLSSPGAYIRTISYGLVLHDTSFIDCTGVEIIARRGQPTVMPDAIAARGKTTKGGRPRTRQPPRARSLD